MAVRGQARVVLNREAVSAIDLAMARGFESLAFQVLRAVHVPDAAPFGEGLVEGGAFITYVDGKRIGGDPDAKKPRAFLVRGKGVGVAVGFGFPGRFQELGTVHQPPRPFLTPAVLDVVGDEGAVVGALRSAFASALQKKQRRYLKYGLPTTYGPAKGGTP